MKSSAAIALLAIATGAIVTGIVTSGDHASLIRIHAALGIAAVSLVCFNRALGWRVILLVLMPGVLECLLRNQTVPTVIVHACLAPVFFSICVAIAMKRDPSAPSTFRLVVRASPALVLLQIVLGAAYRHKAIGVMPHMAGAALVAGLLLVVGVMVLQRFPQSSPLRSTAGTLLAIVLLQVSLGIAVLVMRLLDFETTPAFVATAVTHVVVGSLTLAATTVLAIRV